MASLQVRSRSLGYSTVVVDDGSTDGTQIAAERAGAPLLLRTPSISVRAPPFRPGINFSLAKGAEAIVTFDADGQHAAADISRLVEPHLDRGECRFRAGQSLSGRLIQCSAAASVIAQGCDGIHPHHDGPSIDRCS